jgi:hypothetical protein
VYGLLQAVAAPVLNPRCPEPDETGPWRSPALHLDPPLDLRDGETLLKAFDYSVSHFDEYAALPGTRLSGNGIRSVRPG